MEEYSITAMMPAAVGMQVNIIEPSLEDPHACAVCMRTLPVIGWASVYVTECKERPSAYRIEPVLLDPQKNPMVWTEYRQDREDIRIAGYCYAFTRSDVLDWFKANCEADIEAMKQRHQQALQETGGNE